jgi:hypothetical protein
VTDNPYALPPEFFQAPEPEEETSGSDYGKAFQRGAIGAAADVAGYGARVAGEGGGASGLRDSLSTDQQAVKLSRQAEKNARANFLPTEGQGNDVWDSDISMRQSLGLKLAETAPSVMGPVAGGIVGGLLGGPVGAAVVGLGLAATQSAGGTARSIREEILAAPPESMQENAVYRGLLEMGYSDREAREHVIEETTGYLPELMGVVTAVTGRMMGAEGRVIDRAGGKNLGGLRQRVGRGAAGEAGQEFIEGVAGETAEQKAYSDALNRPFDPSKIAEAGVQGGVLGGIMGGGVSAALGARRQKGPKPEATHVDADQEAALKSDAPNSEVQPEPLPEDVTSEGKISVPDLDTEEAPLVEDDVKAVLQGTPEEVAQTITKGIEERLPELSSAIAPPQPEAVSGTVGTPAAPEQPVIDTTVPQGVAPQAPAPVDVAPPVAPLQQVVPPVETSAPISNDISVAPLEITSTGKIETGGDVRPETAVSGTDVPRETAGPKTLPDLTPESQKYLEELNKTVANNLKQAKKETGEIQTRTRVRDLGKAKSETLRQEKDHRPFFRRAGKVVSEAKTLEDVPEYYRAGLEAIEDLSKARGAGTKQAGKRQEAKERLAAARAAELAFVEGQEKELSAKAQVSTDLDTQKEKLATAPRTAKERQGLEKAAARADVEEKARSLVQGQKPTKAEERGDKVAVAAIRARLTATLAAAKEQGIELRGKSPYVQVLRDYEAKLNALKSGSFPKGKNETEAEAILRFVGTDFQSRAGETKDARQDRQIQQDIETKSGPAETEEGVAVESAEKAAHEVEDEVLEKIEAPAEKEELAPDAGRERQQVVTKGPVTFEGKDRAGTFKVEPARKRVVNVPGKKPAPKAPAPVAREVPEGWDIAETDTPSKYADTGVTVKPRMGDPVPAKSLGNQRELVKWATGRTPPTTLHDAFRRHLFTRFNDISGTVPAYVVDRAGMRQLWKAATGKDETPSGYYDPLSDEMVFLDEALYAKESSKESYSGANLVLHEVAHAALHSQIDSNPEFKQELNDLRGYVEDYYDEKIDEAKRKGEVAFDAKTARERVYGLKNEHEFLSELVSNRDFQTLLRDIPAPYGVEMEIPSLKSGSVWDWFVAMVRKLLRIGSKEITVLDQALRALQKVTEAEQAAMNQVYAAAELQREDYQKRTGRTLSDDQLTAIARRSLMNRRLVSVARPAPMANFKTKDEVRHAAFDQANATRRRLADIGSKAATLDYLRILAGRLAERGLGFVKDGVDLYDSVVNRIHKVAPLADRLREEGEKHAARLIELQKKHPDHKEAMAWVVQDASNLEVMLVDKQGATQADLEKANPHWGVDSMRGWQGRSQAMRVQAEFEHLPAEVRKSLLEMDAYFKREQKAYGRAQAMNFMRMATHLTQAQKESIAEKTIHGTLADAEERLVNDKVLFKQLKEAGELRVKRGLYFPQMRFGRYVVTTVSPITDPMGGKVEGNDVVFRGPDSDAKKLRDAARKFAALTEFTLRGEPSIRYFDPATGRQISAEDAKGLMSYELEYRVPVQTLGRYDFDTRAEGEEFLRKWDTSKGKPSDVEERKDYHSNSPGITSQELESLLKSVDQRDDLNPQERAVLKTALRQGAMSQMAGNRVSSRSLPHRKVAGASEDLARTLTTYAEVFSRARAKAEYLPGVLDDLVIMHKMASEMRNQKTGSDERNRLLQELENRINENVVKINEPSRLVSDILTLSFFDKLVSPAYNVINSLQVATVTQPYLSGKYGFTQTAKAMGKAYKDIGVGDTIKGGALNTYQAGKDFTSASPDKIDLVDNIARKVGGKRGAMIKTLQESGAISASSGFEIAAAVAQGRGKWGTGLARFDRVFRQMPAAIEAMNRSVAALAAYDLATSKGKTHEQATQEAADVVRMTQFDYSNVNQPKLFHHPVAMLALQFKKYALGMSQLLIDVGRRSLPSNMDAADKKIARKQLFHYFATQVMVAGSLSVPGIELIKAISMVGAALGLGGGWEDEERRLREIHEAALGKYWGELVSRGVVSRALGVDVSQRMSLADLWLYGEPKKYDAQGLNAYAWQQVAGAPGSMVLGDWFEGARSAAEGEWTKAGEKMLPLKVVADSMQAYRKQDEMTVADQALKVAGFRSARLANESEQIGKRKSEKEDKETTRKRLEKAYESAKTPGERVAAVSKINDFNKSANFREKISVKYLDKKKANKETRRRELRGD